MLPAADHTLGLQAQLVSILKEHIYGLVRECNVLNNTL